MLSFLSSFFLLVPSRNDGPRRNTFSRKGGTNKHEKRVFLSAGCSQPTCMVEKIVTFVRPGIIREVMEEK